MTETIQLGTQWAYRLMEREAAGEAVDHLSVLSWREVLGFDEDITAQEALEAVRGAA
jgi:hypothetical protein